MDKVNLTVGSECSTSGGAVDDRTRKVEFVGEMLGELRELGEGRDGSPTDTRGTTQTLYRTEDGRMVVYVEDWSHWQGEPNTYTLVEATDADFEPNGRFYDLGVECGLPQSRSLTLDEALTE